MNAEDREDLAAFEERADEQVLSHEEFWKSSRSKAKYETIHFRHRL